MTVPWSQQPPSLQTLHEDVCVEFTITSACFKGGRPRRDPPSFHPEQPRGPQFLGASRGASRNKTVLIGMRCLSVACPCTTPVGCLHEAGRTRTTGSSTQLDPTDGSHSNQRLDQAYLSTSAKTFPGPYSQSTWMKSNPEHLCQLGSPSRP